MNGFLNINKPKGISSYDVIRILKPGLGKVKIGHTGTLDPIADGSLVIAIGNATRLIEYLQGTKVYKAELELGKTSNTYDLTGEVKQNDIDISQVSKESLMKIAKSFTGEIEQVPPIYSAVKVRGAKAYEIARRGEWVDLKARKVQIYKIEINQLNLPKLEMTVECSKGTYIRSLVNDIGKKLNTGAVMTKLTRLQDYNFKLSDSIKIEDIKDIQDILIPAEQTFADFSYKLPQNIIEVIKTGSVFDFEETLIPKLLKVENRDKINKFFFALNEEGKIISVNKKVEKNKFHPEKVFLNQ